MNWKRINKCSTSRFSTLSQSQERKALAPLSLSGTNFFEIAQESMKLDQDDGQNTYGDKFRKFNHTLTNIQLIPQLRKSAINFNNVSKFNFH